MVCAPARHACDMRIYDGLDHRRRLYTGLLWCTGVAPALHVQAV